MGITMIRCGTSQQSKSQSSYGQGQALGPEGLSFTQDLQSVNADSGSSNHTPSLGAPSSEETTSAGSHSGASFSMGNKGKEHGEMDTEREKEEKKELSTSESTQDTGMSTSALIGQSQQAPQSLPLPLPPRPPPFPG